MDTAVRYRFLDPDGLAAGQPNLTCEFVRASDFDNEQQLRMRAVTSLMQRDLEMEQARERIKLLEAKVSDQQRVVDAFYDNQSPVY
jgi:hypothetical protein